MPVVHINCVYGKSNIDHVRNVLIPALGDCSSTDIIFNAINYDPSAASKIDAIRDRRVEIRNIPNPSNGIIGFAEANNILANACDGDFFILINPDCIPQKGCVDDLINAFLKSPKTIGIVEGRQWPFEHPKEYDPLTLLTPWASGAFALINAAVYKAIGGMDERYFLYLEDVDLSWRMWLSGFAVVYEPSAAVTHFTGGRFYRDDLIENEKFYSIRNFVLIMRKFFGDAGEKKARNMVSKSFHDGELVSIALREIDENFRDFLPEEFVGVQENKHIKVLGINQFHEMRA